VEDVLTNPTVVEPKLSITESQVGKLINSFLSGRSKQTREAYSADLQILSRFTNYSTVTGATKFLLCSGGGHANGVVYDFKNWMIDSGYSSNTINRRLASIRSLIKLAKLLGIITFEIQVQNLKVQILRDTRGPQNPDVQKILKYLAVSDRPKNARDTAIIRLLHDLALRATELVSLDVCDFDEDRKTISVMGKGMREKTLLELPGPTFTALKRWISYRGKLDGHLFPNFDRSCGKDRRLTRQGLRTAVLALAKKAGVTPKTTHAWRHTSITQAIINAQKVGLGLEVVLDHSRHSKNSINLLMTYRDRFQNIQGKISNMVATQADSEDSESG
jgi:integrase/recombinase XerC